MNLNSYTKSVEENELTKLTSLENLILTKHGIAAHAARAVGLDDAPTDDELCELIMRDHPKEEYVNEHTLKYAIKNLRDRNILK